MSQAGYKYLKTYMVATVIYDLTVQFCNRWVGKSSRTHDQMTQAARSGKQNIAEGYSFESLKSYIKLLGVSLGSIKELREDYEDFLRQRGLTLWTKNDPRVEVLRGFRVMWVGGVGEVGGRLNTPVLPQNPEEAANLLITLCNQAEFLLTKQISALKEKFIQEGGWTEKMFKKRLNYRKRRLGGLG